MGLEEALAILANFFSKDEIYAGEKEKAAWNTVRNSTTEMLGFLMTAGMGSHNRAN